MFGEEGGYNGVFLSPSPCPIRISQARTKRIQQSHTSGGLWGKAQGRVDGLFSTVLLDWIRPNINGETSKRHDKKSILFTLSGYSTTFIQTIERFEFRVLALQQPSSGCLLDVTNPLSTNHRQNRPQIALPTTSSKGPRLGGASILPTTFFFPRGIKEKGFWPPRT